MEEEDQSSEVTKISTPVVEDPTSPKDSNEDEVVSLNKTIQIENSLLKTSSTELGDAVSSSQESAENRRKKNKEEKPHSKIVVRRLPPTMTKQLFLEQVSPLPEVDYMYYIQGDVNNGINPFSRAYLNFVSQDDLFSFSRTFDNYVFLDSKGQEYPAVVEFAMFQRVPKQRPKKKDPLTGTIESDPMFITFKENLLAEALENSKTGGKAVKQHYFETEISTAEEVNTTPLLEFLKVRRAEKARMREERREEKKRKDLERKLKQKTKDKKGEGDEEEPAKETKMQHKSIENHEKETLVERNKQTGENEESVKNNELSQNKKTSDIIKDSVESHSSSHDQKISILAKTDKDKHQNENESLNKDADVQKIKEAEQQTMYLRKLLGLLPSDGQSPASKKEVQIKDKREIKERDIRTSKKRDDKERVKETRVREFKSRGGKSYQEERLRLAERREEQKKRELLNSGEKRQECHEPNDAEQGEAASEGPKVSEDKTSKYEKKKYDYRKKYDDDWKDDKRRNRNEKNNMKRDGRERKDDYRRFQDKKMNDSDPRRKVKTYKNSEFSKGNEDKKKSPPFHEQQADGKNNNEVTIKDKSYDKNIEMAKDKWQSVDDLSLVSTVERKKSDIVLSENTDLLASSKKRFSSLENIRHEENKVEAPPKKVTVLQREKTEHKETRESSSNYRSRKDLSSHKSNAESKMYSSKKKDRYNERHEEGKEQSECSSRGKNQDQEGDGIKSKDIPRPDRRIRNKDRPSIEIYRPGMGKFSKQRLEKEKALGSSTEVDSPSHSPSPTPKTKIVN